MKKSKEKEKVIDNINNDILDDEELKEEQKNLKKSLKKKETVIKTYEGDVKKYRDAYLNYLETERVKKEIELNNSIESSEDDNVESYDNNNDILFSVSLTTICEVFSIIFALCIVFVFDFNIIAIIFSIIFVNVVSYLFCYFTRNMNLTFLDEYKKKIHKLGYLTIDEYEDDLETYIMGPDGVFHDELLKLFEEYNVDTNNIDFVYSQKGTKYYVWSTNNMLYLLNTDLDERPEVIKVPISNVIYYRVDYDNKLFIIKTYNEELYFEESSVVILSKYLKGLEYSYKNLTSPENAISDYRTYMYNIKNIMESADDIKFYKADMGNKNLYMSMLGLVVFTALSLFPLDNVYYTNFYGIGIMYFMYLFNHCLFGIYGVIFLLKRDPEKILEDLKYNTDCINKFNELKMSLGISDSNCDTVYNTSNQPYLIWEKGGYIHLFFNVIYYDTLYLSFKLKDVNNYYIEDNVCKLFIQDTGLEFNIESKDILDKYLKKKDE